MKSKYFVLLVCFLSIGCDDILEVNINDEQVALEVPSEGASASAGNITFWWNELEGARSYQLLIVSPDFQSPKTLLLDSTVTTNKFSVELPVGKYQWCVKGINEGYQTEYNCRSLEIVN